MAAAAASTSTTSSSPPSYTGLEGNLTLALPAPRSTPPPIPPSAGRRFPAPCWTQEETLALIESYREKWLSLRRGNLRATHWQDVADAVASRCRRLLGAASLKTSVQCRHKIEKLRKRYRAERQRSLRLDPTSPPHSSWAFFGIMDGMDINGGGASSVAPRPPLVVAPCSSPSLKDSSSSSEADTDEEEDEGGSNSSMGNGRNRVPADGFLFKIPRETQLYSELPMRTSSTPNGRRVREKFKHPEMGEKRRREEKEQKGGDGGDVVGEIAAAVRVLGEGVMRMERMKLDMSGEFERARIEMELKRTEMFIDLHRRIVDAFVAGIAGTKKRRRAKRVNEC